MRMQKTTTKGWERLERKKNNRHVAVSSYFRHLASWSRPTQLSAVGTVDGEDVVAIFELVVGVVEGQAVPAQPELRNAVLAAPVGVALALVGEEAVVFGTQEVLVDYVTLSHACARSRTVTIIREGY